ncbi:alanyl-tRNA editing protein [Candidatus Roizmanbacteria bacterium]|nr:alanyl-tRNA editing protein [Candidatus Roizmanbacteria bacterium]
MQTKQVYYEDPYLKELECTVVSVEPSGNFINIITDQTVFYPEGGGQPSDRGNLGNAKVEYVRISNGEIIHQVKGDIQTGKIVKAVLDWNWRYKYMQIHSAGHLIHDVLMTMVKGINPLKGGHGKKAFIEYQGEIDINLKEKLETEVNTIVQQGLEIVTKFSTFDELCQTEAYR